jgi:3-phenylpropionate/trans-cinnamate dioxygenase ferredoxin reductase subunit/anthranilate 1,2-dioxygenase ferredoxin reductase subunit
MVAAAAMVGQSAAEYAEIPWLWSDQFDLNLQMLGVPERAVRFRTRGDPDSTSWTIVGLDEKGLPVSGVAINSGRDIALIRRAISRGTPLPDDFFQPTALAS